MARWSRRKSPRHETAVSRSHPSLEQLTDWVLGNVRGKASREILQHVNICQGCRLTLDFQIVDHLSDEAIKQSW